MKIIVRILVILLLASAVSGILTLIVNNSSAGSAPGMDGEGQPPALNAENGQNIPSGERPQGGSGGNQGNPEFGTGRPQGEKGGEGGLLSRGLIEVGISVVKLAVIIIVVLLIRKSFSLITTRRQSQVG